MSMALIVLKQDLKNVGNNTFVSSYCEKYLQYTALLNFNEREINNFRPSTIRTKFLADMELNIRDFNLDTILDVNTNKQFALDLSAILLGIPTTKDRVIFLKKIMEKLSRSKYLDKVLEFYLFNRYIGTYIRPHDEQFYIDNFKYLEEYANENEQNLTNLIQMKNDNYFFTKGKLIDIIESDPSYVEYETKLDQFYETPFMIEIKKTLLLR
jgi:adenylate kinase family enzyme